MTLKKLLNLSEPWWPALGNGDANSTFTQSLISGAWAEAKLKPQLSRAGFSVLP